MLCFFVSLLPVLIVFSNSALSLHPHPSWTSEMPLLSFSFCQQFLCFLAHWLNILSSVGVILLSACGMMLSKKKNVARIENVGEISDMSILDLPDLALEVILSNLSPAGLHTMSSVSSSLRDSCRSDHLWERHMKNKWGKFIGNAARKEWQLFLSSWKNLTCEIGGRSKRKGLLGLLSCVASLQWLRSRINGGCKQANYFPNDSLMSWYLALESGKFWFPAQVYNREHGHVGFMLSCYDADLSYDCHTDTFRARYPPHGRRTIVIEEGVQWDRVRAPPVDTSPHDLHVSDCLDVLRPGDHIEIQWRRNKEFPYGWWYGVVGHLESCDGNEQFCLCHTSDTIILEFNQYTVGSRWRHAEINRKDHREEGNETDGFYGGIRKLQSKDEIEMWKRLWPTDALE